jgi:hypothetical protein
MKIDVEEIESIILSVSKGVALVFPVTAPFVGFISAAISAFEAAGIEPEVTDAITLEQIRAQSAGIEAAKASVRTEVSMLGKQAEPVSAQLPDAVADPNGTVLVSTVGK